MSFNIEGQKCPVCNAYLFSEDDVVFCPDCGAPHHRNCYNSLNHCALEQSHGTAQQYNPEVYRKSEEAAPKKSEVSQDVGTVKCANCGNLYDSSLKNCPECSAPNVAGLGRNYIVFDFLGGVPAETQVGEGVTAKEAKDFVATNTHRYIPKFVAMFKGQKASWNLFAFFFPSAWAFSRKMYKQGAWLATLNIVLTLLMAPFSIALSKYDLKSAGSYDALTKIVLENINDIGIYVVVAASIASILYIAMMILAGIFADRMYYNHAIREIKHIKETSDDAEYDLQRKGGISFIALLLGFALTRFLPNIIIGFLI